MLPTREGRKPQYFKCIYHPHIKTASQCRFFRSTNFRLIRVCLALSLSKRSRQKKRKYTLIIVYVFFQVREESRMTLVNNIYQAQTLTDGISAMLSALPPWFISTAALGTAAAYWCTFKLRLKVARWRGAQRNAILNRLRPLRSRTTSPEPDACEEVDEQRRQGFGGDREQSDSSNAASPSSRQCAVVATSSEIDEFCLGLGLASPRDDDLIDLVVRMLQRPPPPDWPLLHCQGGQIRFVHNGTGHFFHPEVRDIEDQVRRELHHRSRLEMKQLGLIVDDRSPSPSKPSSRTDIGNDTNAMGTFMSMLEYFKAKEKDKIEREVTESLRHHPPPPSRAPPLGSSGVSVRAAPAAPPTGRGMRSGTSLREN